MSFAKIGDLMEAAAPSVPAPKPKRIVNRLNLEQSRERAVLCAKMIAEGKRNAYIKRECMAKYQSLLSDRMISEMRRGEYRGVGAEAFAAYGLTGAKNADAVQPKADVRELQSLREAFARCLRLMRTQDITSATLDAVKNEAEIEVRATKRMSL